MLSISISFLLFELWLLRIFRLSWMYFESHLFCAALEVAQHFLKLLFRRSKLGAHRQQSAYSWGSRDRCLLSKYPFLSSFASVEGRLSRPSAEQCWRASSTEDHPAWSYFLDLEHVAFFVSHYSGFLVFVVFFQEVDVFMFDTATIWGRPKLSCVWWSRTPSWSPLWQPTFWLTTHSVHVARWSIAWHVHLNPAWSSAWIWSSLV